MFRVLGRAYRRLFMNLDCLLDTLSDATPTRAAVLDVGGGDGAPVNGLVARRRDVTVTMIDPGPSVGGWIDHEFRGRVTCSPHTSLDAYLASGVPLPDVVFILDVIHHIPPQQRPSFFSSLGRLLECAPDIRILIKEVEPGHLRSTLGVWSDRYITADRTVSLIGKASLIATLERQLGSISCRESSLFLLDPPNYLIEIRRENCSN